jgi:hypothetical protein
LFARSHFHKLDQIFFLIFSFRKPLLLFGFSDAALNMMGCWVALYSERLTTVKRTDTPLTGIIQLVHSDCLIRFCMQLADVTATWQTWKNINSRGVLQFAYLWDCWMQYGLWVLSVELCT